MHARGGPRNTERKLGKLREAVLKRDLPGEVGQDRLRIGRILFSLRSGAELVYSLLGGGTGEFSSADSKVAAQSYFFQERPLAGGDFDLCQQGDWAGHWRPGCIDEEPQDVFDATARGTEIDQGGLSLSGCRACDTAFGDYVGPSEVRVHPLEERIAVGRVNVSAEFRLQLHGMPA